MNNSGFKPFDIGVLVRVEQPEEKKTSGGIILQSSIEAKSIESVQKGILVDKAANAFNGVKDAPEIGDLVFFAKHSGQFLYSHMTADEKEYRVMDSHDIRLIGASNG